MGICYDERAGRKKYNIKVQHCRLNNNYIDDDDDGIYIQYIHTNLGFLTIYIKEALFIGLLIFIYKKPIQIQMKIPFKQYIFKFVKYKTM